MVLKLQGIPNIFKSKRIDKTHDPDSFSYENEIIKFANIMQDNTSNEVQLFGDTFIDICSVTFTIENPKTYIALGNINLAWDADGHHKYVKLRIKENSTEKAASERTIDYDFYAVGPTNVNTGDNVCGLSTQFYGTLAAGTHTIKLIGKCNDGATIANDLGNLIILLI